MNLKGISVAAATTLMLCGSVAAQDCGYQQGAHGRYLNKHCLGGCHKAWTYDEANALWAGYCTETYEWNCGHGCGACCGNNCSRWPGGCCNGGCGACGNACCGGLNFALGQGCCGSGFGWGSGCCGNGCGTGCDAGCDAGCGGSRHGMNLLSGLGCCGKGGCDAGCDAVGCDSACDACPNSCD